MIQSRKATLLNPVSVTLENCSKTFGQTMVLPPFTLHIQQGKKVVLLGPSGCGKTTTLRLIAGLELPDVGGKVFLGEHDVTAVPVERRHIGMMFQQYALFPHMRVDENVSYGLRVRNTPKEETRTIVNEMLEMVHMQHLAKRKVSELSGGQRQRVALARALATRPRVLLLDEPLTALDAILRMSVREEMDQLLTHLGITTVIVTHDQDEAMSLGDQIVVMKDGRIEQIGSPREIYHNPATAFVAGFIGGSNHLQGILDDNNVLHLPGEGTIHLDGTAKLPDMRGEIAVFFRPDQASLGKQTSGTMHGTVLSAHFLGEKSRLIVQLDNKTQVKVDLTSGEAPQPGESVEVYVAPDAFMLFNT